MMYLKFKRKYLYTPNKIQYIKKYYNIGINTVMGLDIAKMFVSLLGQLAVMKIIRIIKENTLYIPTQ